MFIKWSTYTKCIIGSNNKLGKIQIDRLLNGYPDTWIKNYPVSGYM